jgi:O-antigen/teichoic acid export membrane protein
LNFSLIGTGFFFPAYASLIGINILSKGFYGVALSIPARKSINEMIQQSSETVRIFSKKSIKLLKKYQDFPIFRTPQLLLNNLSTNLPIILLTALSGPASAGLYGLGARVLKLPAIVVSEAVSKVFEQKVAETANSGKSIYQLIFKTTIILSIVGILPFVLIIVIGPRLFSWVFGSEWFAAGQYARWLALWLFFSFINRPSVKAIPVLFIQKQYLIFEISSLILRIISMVIGFLITKDDIITIAIFSIVNALLNLGLIVYVLFYSKKSSSLINEFGINISKED